MINTAMPREKTSDSEAGGIKKRDRYPSSEGGVKERDDEGGYNRFIILSLCEEDISASVFHHFTM